MTVNIGKKHKYSLSTEKVTRAYRGSMILHGVHSLQPVQQQEAISQGVRKTRIWIEPQDTVNSKLGLSSTHGDINPVEMSPHNKIYQSQRNSIHNEVVQMPTGVSGQIIMKNKILDKMLRDGDRNNGQNNDGISRTYQEHVAYSEDKSPGRITASNHHSNENFILREATNYHIHSGLTVTNSPQNTIPKPGLPKPDRMTATKPSMHVSNSDYGSYNIIQSKTNHTGNDVDSLRTNGVHLGSWRTSLNGILSHELSRYNRVNSSTRGSRSVYRSDLPSSIGMPGFLRNIKLPPIPEITTQEYDNPAFEEDSAARSTDSALEGSTPTSTSSNGVRMSQDVISVSMPGDRLSPMTTPSGSVSPGRRKSSIADVALTLTSGNRQDSLLNLMELAAPHRFQRGKHFRYCHPFGNTTSIVDELFPLEDEFDMNKADAEISNVQSSPAKLVIWIVFSLFMVGVAGAIILGAESYEQIVSNSTLAGNSTYSRGVGRTMFYRTG